MGEGDKLLEEYNNLKSDEVVVTPKNKLLDRDIKNKEILDLLLQGKSNNEIALIMMEKYKLKRGTVNNLITRAYKTIRTNYDVEIDNLIHKHIHMYYDIMNDAKQLGDSSARIKALQAIEKLLKVTSDAPIIQQNTLNLNLKELSKEEIKEMLGLDNE